MKKECQLAAFRKNILENPPRNARRKANRQYFTKARQIVFCGKSYWAYGNKALLELPMIVAIKGHRRPMGECCAGGATAKPGDCKTGAALMAAASRIGPGGAGLSTSLSPLEKAAGNAIIAADKMNQAVHNDGDCNGGDTDALLEKLIEARKISHNSSYFFYGSRKVCKGVPKPSTSRTLWTLREINEARYFIAASMMQEGAPWRGACVASAHMGKNMV